MTYSYSRKRKIAKKLYILLLLFFSIEFIGWGAITIYRVVIFPLSLFLMAITFSMPRLKVANIVNLGWVIYFLWYCLCQFITSDNPLFPIFTIPLAITITNFISLKEPIDIDYPSIFVWYLVPHIVAVIVGSDYLMDGARFCGAHDDANFCGQLISISLLSALFLFKRKLGVLRGTFFLMILVLDAVLLFLTGSRGAMLSIVLVLVVMLLLRPIHRGYKIAIIGGGVLFVVFLLHYIQTLPDFVSPDDSLIDSVLCRFKSDNFDEGGGRVDLWETALSRMFGGGYFFTPIGHIAATQGSINKYTHNTFLDFLVENGIVVGLIMVFLIIRTLLGLLKKVTKKRMTVWDTDFVFLILCSMSQFFFISAITEKIVWLFILSAFALKKKYSVNIQHSKIV